MSERPGSRLSGRVAVVTGGTRGLGLAIASAFGREGAKAVVVGSRSQDSVDSAVAALRDEGFEAAGLSVDVAVRSQVESLRDLACERYGTVDVWVNNAGLSSPYGPAHLVPSERFLESTDTVVRGTYFGSLAALDVFVPQSSGHLVNLLGRGDKGPVRNQAAYAAAKMWVRSFTLSLAAEQRGTGVHVHAFNPGLVRTDLLGKVSAVRGYEGSLARFPAVVSMLGRSADEAALPAVDLVCGDPVEYQALRPLGLLRAVASYGAARLAKRPREVLPMTVTTVEPRV